MNDFYHEQAQYWNQMFNAAIEEERVAIQKKRPCYLLRPSLKIDGDKWCALYGDNIQDGVAGFGDTPEKAFIDFDIQFLNAKPLNVKAQND